MRIRRRWLGWLAGLALVAALAGTGAAWRHRVTRPEYRLRRGQEALLRRDWDAAYEWADRLEASGHPDHAHLLRGQVYLHRGNLERAILEYNAIRQDQKEVLAEASLVYGLGLLSLGKLVEAERLLLYVLEVHPENVDVHRGLAKIHYERGALAHTLKPLEEWSRLAPEDGEPHRWMGLAYEGLGADTKAGEHYRLALSRKLSPRLRDEATFDFAQLLVRQLEHAEALATLDANTSEALSRSPDVTELRAECLYGLGKTTEAVRILDQLLKDRPDSPRVLMLRAQVHLAAGEAGPAVELLEKAVRLDPQDHASRYQLVQAYEALGRRKEAAEQQRLLKKTEELMKQLSDLSQEANDKPTDSQVRRRLAEVCAKLNKHDLVQKWLRAAAACPTPDGTPNRGGPGAPQL
jgi:tetratricopeptide (TPR) repeat protein